MKRCMFVDDSSVIRKVARRIPGGSDMLIIEAANGLDAVEMCAADMPDIIIVDGALPDMQAEDVIRRARHGKPGSAPDSDFRWLRSTSLRSCGQSAPALKAIC
jgi:CheY-like chemotaxis protein